jgi:hypothetical protein
VCAGASTRIILEFALPKDGSFILPYNYEEFYDYGTAASADLPTFVDPAGGSVPQWDPSAQPCEQSQFKDYSGVDSLTAFLVSILVFTSFQVLEDSRGGKPLFTFAGMEPYEKGGEKQSNDSTVEIADASSGDKQADKAVEAIDDSIPANKSVSEGELDLGEQE